MRPNSISDVRRPPFTSPTTLRWGALAALVAGGVVLWEYALNAVLNPTVDWSPLGVAAHAALDLALLLPIAVLAMLLGVACARRLGMLTGEASEALGVIGLLTVAFLVLSLPVTATRDIAHEAFGLRTGLALAEVRTTVVSSDLTVQEATQLCSFGSVRNPNAARAASQNLAPALPWRLESALRDTLVQLAAFLPLLALGLLALFPSFRPHEAIGRLRQRTRPMKRYLRAATLGIGSFAALLWVADLGSPQGAVAAETLGGQPAFNACTQGGSTKSYDVSAIDVVMPLNRWGDHVERRHMYALNANIADIRSFEAALEADRTADEGLDVARVSHGLRKDPIQPLVIRANLGECLQINFTNASQTASPPRCTSSVCRTPSTAPAARSADNPDTMAGSGRDAQLQIPIPLDRTPSAPTTSTITAPAGAPEHGPVRRHRGRAPGLHLSRRRDRRAARHDDRQQLGSDHHRSQPRANQADGKSFREFVIMYHEIGDEAFTDIRDKDGKKLPLIDELAGIYRPAARALNYRSEPFRNRMAQDSATNGARSRPRQEPRLLLLSVRRSGDADPALLRRRGRQDPTAARR